MGGKGGTRKVTLSANRKPFVGLKQFVFLLLLQRIVRKNDATVAP